jgi:hypothetical protein
MVDISFRELVISADEEELDGEGDSAIAAQEARAHSSLSAFRADFISI